MALQWFDLKDQGAKLERPDNGRGETFLRLSLGEEASPEQIKLAAARGWIPDDNQPGKVFTNFTRFSRLSEVADLVSAFIEREKVTSSKADASRLSQGEIIRGFADASLSQTAGMLPKLSDVAGSLDVMPDELRQRILSRVEAAQKLVGIAPGADGSALFRNDGAAMWRSLTDKFGAHDATKAMLTVMHLAEIAGEDFQTAHNALIETALGDVPLDFGVSGRALDFAEARALRTVDHIAAEAKVLQGYDRRWTDDKFYRAFMQTTKAQYRTWDGARIDFSGVSDAPSMFGNTLRCDPNLPTAWRHDMGHRISHTIQFVAMELGVSPHELFHGKKQLFHVGLTSENTVGYRAEVGMKIGGVVHRATAIKVNPFMSGALVHEIGHGVDLSARHSSSSSHSDEMMHAMLVDTGVQAEVSEMVDRLEAAQLASPKYAAYLKMPEEIIARSFEAAIAERADMAGDEFYREFGGMTVLNGSIAPQPTPDNALKFLEVLRQVVSASLAREAIADIDKDYNNNSPSP